MTGSTQTVKGGQDGNNANNGKRAEWEQFGFADLPNGNVQVCNHSHGEDAGEHTYEVETDADGDAIACTCPHHQFRNERCKHMIGVDERADEIIDGGDEGVGRTVAVMMGENGERREFTETELYTLQNALSAQKRRQQNEDRPHIAGMLSDLRERLGEVHDD